MVVLPHFIGESPFSSRLYHAFDSVVLLSHGRALYSGPGGLAPAKHFRSVHEWETGQGNESEIPKYEEGYNVADYLLEIASAAPIGPSSSSPMVENKSQESGSPSADIDEEVANGADLEALSTRGKQSRGKYAATFLTQFEVLCGREWKILCR